MIVGHVMLDETNFEMKQILFGRLSHTFAFHTGHQPRKNILIPINEDSSQGKKADGKWSVKNKRSKVDGRNSKGPINGRKWLVENGRIVGGHGRRELL